MIFRYVQSRLSVNDYTDRPKMDNIESIGIDVNKRLQARMK
jgi:hypothetical protein